MLGFVFRRHGFRRKPFVRRSSVWHRVVPLERLESRQLLSAVALPALAFDLLADPALHPQPGGHGGSGVTNAVPPSSAYTPGQIQQAYGFNQVPYAGTNLANLGSGQTIAIVDAYGDSSLSNDLATFDAEFGLPAPPSLNIVNQTGGTKLPSNNSGWALETSLDVEWAHAMAPAANLLLVEANSSSLDDLLTAVSYAGKHADVVSMSWGTGEFAGETSYDGYFTAPGVTYVAASGDSGAPALWPAVSPNVLGVGGTSLLLSLSNRWSAEAGWKGSDGGVSQFELQPSFQSSSGLVSQSSQYRTSPDVAYDADPTTGVAVYDSIAYNNHSGWFQIGGTSAGAPQWSAIVAAADQGRRINGDTSLPNAQASLYGVAANAVSYSADFHDITSGSNNASSAGTGYDLVSGLGTPNVPNLVAALVHAQPVTTVTTTAASAKSDPPASSTAAGSATSTAPTVVIEIIVLDLLPTPAQPAFVPLVINAARTSPAPAVSLVMPGDAPVQLATNSMLTDDPLAVPFMSGKRAGAAAEKQTPDEAPAPRGSAYRAWQLFGDEALAETGLSSPEASFVGRSGNLVLGDSAAVDVAVNAVAEQLALLTDNRTGGLTAAVVLFAAAVLFEKGSRRGDPATESRTAPRLFNRRW